MDIYLESYKSKIVLTSWIPSSANVYRLHTEMIENIYAALNVKCIFISPNRIKETIYTNFYDGI